MLSTLKLSNFHGVPHLATSSLMVNNPQGLSFSMAKPNVVVGPNGSGKSALLTTLAYLTLSYIAGYSSLDGKYCSAYGVDHQVWSEVVTGARSWDKSDEYLAGLVTDYDGGRALYYRPGHLPGNESFVAAAIMQGYGDDARAYAELTEDKSSGQQSQAVQSRIMAVLAGQGPMPALGFHNWGRARTLEALEQEEAAARERRWHDRESKHGKLLRRYLNVSGEPMVLMDEPEQSLDARAEVQLWHRIANAVSGVQVIVATHSLYPVLHPEQFHIIEAVPGYVAEVQQALGL